jgi:sarcosine dehydrogenase
MKFLYKSIRHFNFSRVVLEKLIDADLGNDAFPLMTHQTVSVKGSVECRALRVGWTGELGWELHIPSENMLGVYDALCGIGGWKHSGWKALMSLSAEKGHHQWNNDVRIDDDPIEAGLGFICRKDGEYVGKKHVEQTRKEGTLRKYAFFTLDSNVR